MMRRTSLGILVLLWSLSWLSGCGEEEELIFFPSKTTDATYEEVTSTSISQEANIMVYVCGAVEHPGVVSLGREERVVDAIALAGGMTPQADETYVNLAARLTDGEKIYVPTVTETAIWKAEEEKSTLVNINEADIEELCTLSGIGESKAEDIVRYREENGAFRTKEELMKVPGIKENLFQKIVEKITVE